MVPSCLFVMPYTAESVVQNPPADGFLQVIFVDTTTLSVNWVKPLAFFAVWPTGCVLAQNYSKTDTVYNFRSSPKELI